ncbi:MAG: site-specific DNA-methyltransferase, partial [Nitrospirae bacterium]|nr:site-specific DNA-methyltransferase [Nitrospirota bacterium]
KCVYIDPPYNAKFSEVLYKNEYKHSSWISMMFDRLFVSSKIGKKQHIHVIAIDENEQERLGAIIDLLFPNFDKTLVTVVHNPGGIQGSNFSYCNEFAYFIFPSIGVHIGTKIIEDANEVSLRDWGGDESTRESARNCFYPIFIKKNNIIGFGEVCQDNFHPKANENLSGGIIAIYPIDSNGIERKWRNARNTIESIRDALKIKEKDGVKYVIRLKNEYRQKTVWDDTKYNSNVYGSKLLGDILGEKIFAFPKSLYTVKDSIAASTFSEDNALILDYFAGSGTTGHATINLNREDGGNRKFILTEMAHYFDTVLLPRVKKVSFSPEWKDGKPKRMATKEEAERSPRIVKYIRLESYEDALNNIQFDDASGQAGLKFDDYLLKYMLHWEARKSETLLNVEKLVSPFSYTLHIHRDGQTAKKNVDIPETFNYLLGLNVKTRQAVYDKERRYLVYRGRIDHREITVIWRETDGWTKADLEQDKKFVASQKLTEGADEVFVNGDSFIPGAKSLEPVFKARMFTEAGI